MNLSRLLFKPKWQDKNPDVRRAAVASSNDTDMIAALPQLARSDADASVRLAALKRFNDYEAWRERSTGDADATVRRAARDAYLALLCSNAAGVPPLPRRIAELDTLSPDEIEKVTTQATDRDLRAAALAYVTRPALLAERAVADPDGAIRLATLERISDAAALERIAERARKTDKAVTRRARELLEAQRIGSGDTIAVAQKARALCDRMEAILRMPTDDEAVYDAISREWNALGNAVPADLAERYRGADALVRQTRINALNPPVRETAPVVEPEVEPEALMPEAPPAEPVNIDLLASQARFDIALANAAAEAQRERDQRRVQVREVEEILPRYAAMLDAGTVSLAHALHEHLVDTTAKIAPLPAALEAKLAPLRARYVELKEQQAWANRRRRTMICDDIEQLAQSGLHPDALAQRVREAREEWQRLDASQGLAHEAESGLSRRFHALCHRAIKPAKAYFDKRDQVRKSQADEIEHLLQEVASLPSDIGDWRAAGMLRAKLGDALRSLDGVDPRVRTELARKLKSAIADLAPRLESHADGVEAAKRGLIARASALQQQTDARNLARDARELQQQWTALGSGRRGSDQRLWKEFRGALDTAFGQLDAVRKQRDEQTTAARAQAEALLAEIDTVRSDGEVHEVRAKLREFDARWQSLSSVDRALDQRFRKSREAIESGLSGAARRKRLARFTQALEKYTLLRQVEMGAQLGDAIATQWADSPAHVEFTAGLEARFAHVASATPVERNESAARDLLVELEFFAGVETPDEDRQRRMNFQVQRLASRMRDRNAATPETELARLICAWITQAPQTAELEDRFVRAATMGIDTLP